MNAQKMITIDGSSSKDLDDGFSIKKTTDGWVLNIYIAAPAYVIKYGDMTFKAAEKQVISHYRGQLTTKPLIDKSLSEGSLSLLPNQKLNAIKAEIYVSRDGCSRLDSLQFVPVINIAKLCYEDISPTPDSSHISSDVCELIIDGLDCARSLFNYRLNNNNSFAFCDEKTGVYTNEEGAPVVFSLKQIHGQILIQEFMIVTNYLIAKYSSEKSLPIIYRNHERLSIDSLKDTKPELFKYYSQSDAISVGKYIDNLVRCAEYGMKSAGHVGLGLPAYATFTSPLRRFVDLYNQYVLFDDLGVITIPEFYTEEKCAHINNALLNDDKTKSENSKYAAAYAAAKQLEKNNSNNKLNPNQLVQIFKRISWPNTRIKAINYLLENAEVQNSGRLWAALINFPTPVPHEIAVQVYKLFISNPEWLQYTFNALTQDGLITTEPDISSTAWVERLLCDSLFLEYETMTAIKSELERKEQEGQVSAINYKGQLLEFCVKNKISPPQFTSQNVGMPHLPLWRTSGEITYLNRQYAVVEQSTNKKEAEQNICKMFIESLVAAKKENKPSSCGSEGFSPSSNFKGELNEMAQKKNMRAPAYKTESVGNNLSPLFESVCTFNKCSAMGVKMTTKKAAESSAAEHWLKLYS